MRECHYMRLMFIPLVRTHTHPYGIGRCVGRVCKEGVWCRAVVFTCNPERPPETLREAAGPPGKVRLVGRGSESSTPPPPPHLTRMFPVSFAMGIKVCLRFHLGKEFCWRWGVETIDVEKRVNLRVRARAPGHGPCPALTSQCVTLCRSLLFSGPWR